MVATVGIVSVRQQNQHTHGVTHWQHVLQQQIK
jgi:hypothetical protein